jgi:hypothetical protein
MEWQGQTANQGEGSEGWPVHDECLVGVGVVENGKNLVERSATAAGLVINVFAFIDAIFDPVAGAVIVAAIHPVFAAIHAIFGAVDATRRAGSKQGGGNSEEQE